MVMVTLLIQRNRTHTLVKQWHVESLYQFPQALPETSVWEELPDSSMVIFVVIMPDINHISDWLAFSKWSQYAECSKSTFTNWLLFDSESPLPVECFDVKIPMEFADFPACHVWFSGTCFFSFWSYKVPDDPFLGGPLGVPRPIQYVWWINTTSIHNGYNGLCNSMMVFDDCFTPQYEMITP